MLLVVVVRTQDIVVLQVGQNSVTVSIYEGSIVVLKPASRF